MARLAGREDRLSVAVSNSPRSSVISGDPDAVQQVMAELERDDVFCRLVKVDVASHSPQMDQPARELVGELDELATRRSPHSNLVDGAWASLPRLMSSMQPIGATTFARPCVFTDAISGLLEDGVSIFVELGPHPILLQSVQQTAQSQRS